MCTWCMKTQLVKSIQYYDLCQISTIAQLPFSGGGVFVQDYVLLFKKKRKCYMMQLNMSLTKCKGI